ncbi:MAG: hypothetical protein IAI50_15460 [Candidatus Eremiobacteraeota bacterium]|nr:hypothetical protein [Candidatus Eremiobacteraeota bacterium]
MAGWLNGVGVATVGDFYGPDSGGSQVASDVGGSAASTDTSPTMGASLSSDSQDKAPAIDSVSVPLFAGLQGINPLLWIPMILGGLVLLRILREWGSGDGEIKEARTGFYFGIMAALWSIAIIPLVKALLGKYHIPGLSEYVQNA